MPPYVMLRRVALLRNNLSGNVSSLSSPILVILMMEAIHFSETSVLTRVTRRNIPEVGILNKTCLLQSTPLHCLYTAYSSFPLNSGKRFAG
jgi:hypothetical protein